MGVQGEQEDTKTEGSMFLRSNEHQPLPSKRGPSMLSCSVAPFFPFFGSWLPHPKRVFFKKGPFDSGVTELSMDPPGFGSKPLAPCSKRGKLRAKTASAPQSC